ncbi:hypothetical protein BDV98DRAFT_578471 [Pterulicium gracile]|uniref:Uncharacterized protein n=1 Tax=Pterulicium gracile TaxID=1884261 RepID=A0A5C3QXY4_9AGAR|nr:hypothetical protein BDV98DRAFT_578471 [Pterula gracilis]
MPFCDALASVPSLLYATDNSELNVNDDQRTNTNSITAFAMCAVLLGLTWYHAPKFLLNHGTQTPVETQILSPTVKYTLKVISQRIPGLLPKKLPEIAPKYSLYNVTTCQAPLRICPGHRQPSRRKHCPGNLNSLRLDPRGGVLVGFLGRARPERTSSSYVDVGLPPIQPYQEDGHSLDTVNASPSPSTSDGSFNSDNSLAMRTLVEVTSPTTKDDENPPKSPRLTSRLQANTSMWRYRSSTCVPSSPTSPWISSSPLPSLTVGKLWQLWDTSHIGG